jgi:hypothetical protein
MVTTKTDVIKGSRYQKRRTDYLGSEALRDHSARQIVWVDGLTGTDLGNLKEAAEACDSVSELGNLIGGSLPSEFEITNVDVRGVGADKARVIVDMVADNTSIFDPFPLPDPVVQVQAYTERKRLPMTTAASYSSGGATAQKKGGAINYGHAEIIVREIEIEEWVTNVDPIDLDPDSGVVGLVNDSTWYGVGAGKVRYDSVATNVYKIAGDIVHQHFHHFTVKVPVEAGLGAKLTTGHDQLIVNDDDSITVESPTQGTIPTPVS